MLKPFACTDDQRAIEAVQALAEAARDRGEHRLGDALARVVIREVKRVRGIGSAPGTERTIAELVREVATILGEKRRQVDAK